MRKSWGPIVAVPGGRPISEHTLVAWLARPVKVHIFLGRPMFGGKYWGFDLLTLHVGYYRMVRDGNN